MLLCEVSMHCIYVLVWKCVMFSRLAVVTPSYNLIHAAKLLNFIWKARVIRITNSFPLFNFFSSIFRHRKKNAAKIVIHFLWLIWRNRAIMKIYWVFLYQHLQEMSLYLISFCQVFNAKAVNASDNIMCNFITIESHY